MFMHDYVDLLNRFQEFILNAHVDIEEDIVSNAQLASNDRLAIYRNAYYLRLLEVISYDFPAFKAHIGLNKFEWLGKKYIDAYPSHNPSIIEFGSKFYDFLKKQSFKGEKLTLQALELARFELEIEKARMAKKTTHFPLPELATIDSQTWPQLTFTLNPSVVIFDSMWSAPMLWENMLANKDNTVASLNKIASNKQSQDTTQHENLINQPIKSTQLTAFPFKKNKKSHWLIWGYNGESFFSLLNSSTHCFLRLIQKGMLLGEICATLCDTIPEENVSSFIGNCLKQWIDDRIIIDFTIIGE
jgi:hypothetical protein